MSQVDNPDRMALAAFMSGSGEPAAMVSSPLLIALNCLVEAAEPGAVTLRFSPQPEHLQGNGVVAGGIVATMIDFALAFAGLTTCAKGETAASIGLNVAFLGPVLAGPVTVAASLVSNGFRIAQAEARLIGPDGRLLASGNSALVMKRLAAPETAVPLKS